MSTAAAAAMPDLTGCTVDGRFRLTRMLGSGTYGVVYEAIDTHASSAGAPATRAIKITRKADRKKHELAAARREIALHGLVSNHPNVVTVHDAYEDDNYFYLVMDFCTGGDLFEPICRQVYVGNDALVRRAFLSLIDAVEACHSLRIYHRDLKPENILVSDDRSQVFLADFGLATNQPIVQEFYCGTAAYMSPECIGHLSGFRPYYTAFSDIWSLGVILVNMISGRNPWEKATLTDPCFVQYVENPDFLFDALAISEGVNDILRHIFLLNPLARLSLQQLRLAILRLDTFFRQEDELSVVESYARAPAPQEQQQQRAAPAAAPSRPVTACRPSNVVSPQPHCDAHASRPPSPHSPTVQRPPGLSSLPSLGGEGRSTGSQSTVGSSGSGASSQEDSMVVTPENSAVGVVVRSNLNEEEEEAQEEARRIAGADSHRIRLEDTKVPVAEFLFPRLDMNVRHDHDHS
ncbi:transporter [Ganoderma sinense ZZ0214-1]|uniref:Transporter n=1 Tax=Ganoderma sinense ZZ0214-1 TaxID=1077348 RepID=A0A2G8SMZ5_9APHY|nr:transporter [Ganoderma sinense ZZ0214-1]